MSYNIHPILVHFPIALLFLYSIIKILPLKKWIPNVGWRDIERVLLLVGVLGASAALATGGTAEHLLRANRKLVNAHANFGIAATWLYGALLAGEIAAIINAKNFVYIQNLQFIKKILLLLEKVFCDPIFSGIIAFIALIAISVTGLLGGVIAYGLTADPVAPFILKLLGITI